jgi:hypothetical protein
MDTPIQAIVAVIQSRTQPPGVLQQVTIRPDKLKGHIIRFGETTADEYNGWLRLEDITLMAVLGLAVEKDGKWVCVPEENSHSVYTRPTPSV